MEAITQWYADGTPAEVDRIERDLFGALDPVQREICSQAFRAWRQQVGDSGQVTFSPAGPSVVEDGHFMSVAIQIELALPDGSVEHFKVKLRTPTSEDERAIITLGGEPGVDYLEVILDPGQVDSLTIDRDRAEELTSELFTLARADLDKKIHAGGFHCWRCDRASLCSQYPPLAESPPPSGTPSVVLGKGTLSHLAECPRRVAWKAIFQFAGDDRESIDPGPALAMGNLFHSAIASALLDTDPSGVMTAHARALAGSEQSEFLGLWESHLDLMAGHGVELTRTELPIGCTAPAPDAAGPLAVTFLGIVDAAGREADGTPAVIEHRTTMRREVPFLEQELYAVAGALAVRANEIAVHHHWLRASGDEACTRRHFTEADLGSARDSLVEAAGVIAGWDREDATDAPFATGEWCAFCPFLTLCSRHRS